MHTNRTTPAKGYRPPSTAKKGRTIGIMVRLMPVDFERLRAQAMARGTPLSAIIRDAVAAWLRSHNGTK